MVDGPAHPLDSPSLCPTLGSEDWVVWRICWRPCPWLSCSLALGSYMLNCSLCLALDLMQFSVFIIVGICLPLHIWFTEGQGTSCSLCVASPWWHTYLVFGDNYVKRGQSVRGLWVLQRAERTPSSRKPEGFPFATDWSDITQANKARECWLRCWLPH